MDLTNRLQETFAKLGYFGTIPIPLQRNPSTSFIWEQFIRNVKPRNEVDACRKNIIINRLKKESSVQVTNNYPIREIQVYNELKDVRENITIIKKRIQEKQSREASLRAANKANYLQINTLKELVEEKKMKSHALKLKVIDMKNRLEQADTTLKTKGVALVSDEDSLLPENVTNILETLVEKIEKLSVIHEFPTLNADKYLMSTPHKISKIQSPRKKCPSTLKKNKSNLSRITKFGSCFNINDTCFDFKADDEFLQLSQSTDDILSMKEYMNPLKKESVFDNSIKCQSTFQEKPRVNYFENAQSDEYLIQQVDKLLYGANIRIIWTSLCNLREKLIKNIRFALETSKISERFKIDTASEDDISKLNFIYVKNNLLTLQCKKKIKQLKLAIQEKKSYIESQLEGHVEENRLKVLEVILENVKLGAAIEFMQKEINNSDKSDCTITLNSLNNKIDQAKEELVGKLKEVESFIESKENLVQKLKKCQNDTMLCVLRLNQFLNDTMWLEGLTENVYSKEINVFKDFPLRYNKKFCFTDNSFYIDSMSKIILDEDTPSDTLHMIHSIIEHPQYPPERIFIESLKKKYTLQVMSSLKFPIVKLEQKNNSLQEFREQENYVDKFCEKITSNIRSWKAYQVLNCSSRMKSNMELWLDMPFKRFISKERMVDGKSYKDYEEKFETLSNS